ncbi:RHE_PE00001 family protein [Rhizobium sp. L1K21]|uniref:RHE_PE00001 family protein n=1 Tax=Rhizobium sp. L1K21 TaxID=2954933 RepID=UPI00209285CB|nr:RHE_PE00001 family protein [Rhizobium sp. L1K21]MCO6188228.1 RHE_PE00001 family protein [Rhizobium sp. L1K21]
MRYDLAKLPVQDLLEPVARATAGLCRLDERVARSPSGAGWIERMHYADAVASMWVDGELVHIEDLVLHDAGSDIRAPTHELTIAGDVLRIRRRIAAQPVAWPLTDEGVRNLRGQGGQPPDVHQARKPEPVHENDVPEPDQFAPSEPDPLADELAALDAVLTRSDALLAGAPVPDGSVARDPLIYEPDWDEDERLGEWRAVVLETKGLPPVLRAVLLLDAWNRIEVFQHARWLGRLLAAASLREAGLTTSAHLVAFNLGLKSISVDQRRNWDRDRRLLAFLNALDMSADIGLREHDKLTLARQTMERRLAGRRSSSRLPELIDLVLSRPMVSTNMIAKALNVTPRAALRLVEELNLRELTGRGRYRAWGVI